jgi:hypothetical protein
MGQLVAQRRLAHTSPRMVATEEPHGKAQLLRQTQRQAFSAGQMFLAVLVELAQTVQWLVETVVLEGFLLSRLFLIQLQPPLVQLVAPRQSLAAP